MKLFRCIILCCLILGLKSCSDDSESLELTNENISGTYSLISLIGKENENVPNQERKSFTTDNYDNPILEFTSEGNFYSSGSFMAIYTIETSNQQIETETEIITLQGDSDFTINPNKTLRIGDIIHSVVSFNGELLKLKAFGGNAELNDQSQYQFNIEFTLRKRE